MSILLFCAICGFLSGCATSLKTIPWKSLGTPEGQNVSTLLPDGHDPSVVYCGSTIGEFNVSLNRGKTWTPKGTIPGNPPLHTLLQHPDFALKLYAGTGKGLFRTDDGGATWQSVSIVTGASPQPACRSVTADPWNPSVLYAGFTGHGVFVSTDDAVTWLPMNGDLDPSAIARSAVENIIAHPQHPGLLFAILSTAGAIRTSDGGDSWTLLTGRFDPSATTIDRIIVHPENSDLICIGTGGGDIYRSENGGTTWELTHQGTGYAPVLNFASDPENNDIHAATATGVFTSENFGGTWTASPNLFPHLPARVATVADSAGKGFYLYGGGIGIRFLPAGGAQWVKADSGLAGPVTFSALRISNDGKSVIAASGSSVFVHGDSGWVGVSDGLPGSGVTAVATDAETDSLWYAATISGPYHTVNGGREWKPLGKRMGGKGFSFIATHPAITNRFLGMTESGMMVSTDNGASWSRTKPPLRGYEIRSMTFHPGNAGIVGAGTSNHGALVSNDGGIGWDESRYGLEGNEILAVTFTSGDQQTYYAWGSDGKGYRSTNKGIEWVASPQPWSTVEHISIAVDNLTPSSVIALVNRKDIYYSATAGMEWVKLPVDPPPSPLSLLSWSGKSRMLYGVSGTEGLYRISVGKEIDTALRK